MCSVKKGKIIVVGGGPAGLMAAGTAAEHGCDVVILEKMKRPARKLCITGKGRCNITNSAEITNFLCHFGDNGSFLRQAFFQFFNEDLITFLEGLGLEIVRERGGRIFPKSGRAVDVLTILLAWLKKLAVVIETSSPVENIIMREGRLEGVLCNGKVLPCQALILATGGTSYPATGSTGDGYRLASMAGHSIVPVRPALVPLETAGDDASHMNGLSLRNILVKLLVDGKKISEEFGELAFAKFGVTGPVTLTLSGLAVDALMKGQKVEFLMDLKPALDEKKLDARLLRDFETRRLEPLGTLLRGLLPKEMIPVCLAHLQIPHDRKSNAVTKEERANLRRWLKGYRFEIKGYRPLKEAIVTAGGVQTKEIDPRTMESRKLKGLYCVGELLDIQGDTGGFNLQAAFSTGRLAGLSAAKICKLCG